MKSGGRRDCPKQPTRCLDYRPSGSIQFAVPDLQSPQYPRQRPCTVYAVFGRAPKSSVMRLATYHFPVGQAVVAVHPRCLAGEFKHMFKANSSICRVSDGVHSALSKSFCNYWIKNHLTDQPLAVTE